MATRSIRPPLKHTPFTELLGDGTLFVSNSWYDWALNLVLAVETLEATDGDAGANPLEAVIIACSDETTALTTGTAKVTFRVPYTFELEEVRVSVTTAPTGATLVVDINESGVSILSTKLSIDAGEKTSTTAAAPAVISDTLLADDAEMTIDFDQVGSTVTGTGLKVTLIGRRVTA